MDHARHYALEMRDPILVIHADVTSEKAFWYAPQLDRTLADKVGTGAADTVTVRIPTEQELPDTAPALLSCIENIYLICGLRSTGSSSAGSFVDSLKHIPDQEKFFRSFHEKNDTLRLQRIKESCLGKKFAEARIRINALQVDPDSTVPAKFLAQIQLRGIDHTECLHTGRPQIELARIELTHAKALQEVTRSGPNYLKFHALIARQAAELRILTHEAAVLFMAIGQHLERGGNPIMALGLYARRLALARHIIFKYNQCLRLARYASTYRDRWMLGQALGSIVNAISVYLITLRYEHNFETEKALAQSALQICKLAAWISSETGDTNSIILSIISAMGMANSIESEAYLWADQIARGLPNEQDRQEALFEIGRTVKRWSGEEVEGDYHGDTAWQIIQNISSTHGIDLDNESDPVVQSLRIAAKDDNPGRVLAKCEHLLVSAGAIGPRALWIQRVFDIGTACSKVVHCTLHNYHVEGREMDVAYEGFRQTHCDSCSDCKPRPEGWRCTDKVKREIEDRHLEFAKRLAGTANGMRFTNED